MELLIAVLQFTPVIDIGQTDWRATRKNDCSLVAAVVQKLGTKDTILIFQTVAGRYGVTKCQQSIGWIIQRSQFRIGQYPDTDAIPIPCELAATRMGTSGFTAIFDIHAEHHPFGLSGSTAPDIINRGDLADTRPDDGIRRGRTRLRSTDLMIIRIAELELVDERSQ